MNNLKSILLLLTIFCVALSIQSCADECGDIVCQNNGTCVDGTCECLDGFSGTNCEIEDLCITQNIICEYDGYCVNGQCECTELTENYMVGSWATADGAYQITLNADGTCVETGAATIWSLDTTSNAIVLDGPGGAPNTFMILESPFDCDNHIWENSGFQFPLVRQ